MRIAHGFKDYAEGGKTAIKKMGVVTFITSLTNPIPEKNFRVVRGYGLFSNRLKGTLLPKARLLLKQSAKKEKRTLKPWRERMIDQYGKDPLMGERCSLEMMLVDVCYDPPLNNLLTLLKLSKKDKMPAKQLTLKVNTR